MLESELLALSRDRRLVTCELHEANEFYGHATLLKAYADLPPNRSLKAVVEHGPPTAGRSLWDFDIQSRLPVVLCASARRAREFAERLPAHKEALPIGPGLAYLPGGLNAPVEPGERRLLVFPLHSSHHFTVDFDVDAFGAAVEHEAAGFDSVEVCLYWRDVLRGEASHYRERGFVCSTAGHMFDPEFLPRFRSTVGRATAVVTNGIGTHLLYAVLLGRPTWLIGEMARDPRVGFLELDRDLAAFDEFVTAFEQREDAVTPRQRALVADFAGIEHVREPEELCEILVDAAARYRQLVSAKRRVASLARRQWLWRRARLRPWTT